MNYYSKTRTNYFKLLPNKEEEFKKLIASVGSEDELEIIDDTSSDGTKYYGFMCDGNISGIPVDENGNIVTDGDAYDYDMDAFYKQLQALLLDDDAVIITTVGSEGFRYLVGEATVITKNKITWIDLETESIELAQKALNNPDWTTKNSY